MKILLYNRNHDAWKGGDAVQVENTMTILQKLGVDCEYSCDPNISFDNFNFVHVFHVNFKWTKDICTRLISARKPYFISSIFFPKEYGVSFMEMKGFIDNSLQTIALSTAERQEMIDLLHCDPNLISIISNGVNKEVFYKDDTKRDDFIVSIGRLQQMKGPQYLIEACKRLGKKLRYISSDSNDPEAYKLIPMFDEYFENITEKEVANILKRSRLYVCPSLTERQSLGVLEAANCGLPIVDSVYNRGNDLLPSSIVVNPKNIEELMEAITNAWDKPRNTDHVPSWEDIGTKLIKLYKQHI
jgi:glycosyltransferase involved in cell wall biosynthesis